MTSVFMASNTLKFIVLLRVCDTCFILNYEAQQNRVLLKNSRRIIADESRFSSFGSSQSLSSRGKVLLAERVAVIGGVDTFH